MIFKNTTMPLLPQGYRVVKPGRFVHLVKPKIVSAKPKKKEVPSSKLNINDSLLQKAKNDNPGLDEFLKRYPDAKPIFSQFMSRGEKLKIIKRLEATLPSDQQGMVSYVKDVVNNFPLTFPVISKDALMAQLSPSEQKVVEDTGVIGFLNGASSSGRSLQQSLDQLTSVLQQFLGSRSIERIQEAVQDGAASPLQADQLESLKVESPESEYQSIESIPAVRAPVTDVVPYDSSNDHPVIGALKFGDPFAKDARDLSDRLSQMDLSSSEDKTRYTFPKYFDPPLRTENSESVRHPELSPSALDVVEAGERLDHELREQVKVDAADRLDRELREQVHDEADAVERREARVRFDEPMVRRASPHAEPGSLVPLSEAIARELPRSSPGGPQEHFLERMRQEDPGGVELARMEGEVHRIVIDMADLVPEADLSGGVDDIIQRLMGVDIPSKVRELNAETASVETEPRAPKFDAPPSTAPPSSVTAAAPASERVIERLRPTYDRVIVDMQRLPDDLAKQNGNIRFKRTYLADVLTMLTAPQEVEALTLAELEDLSKFNKKLVVPKGELNRKKNVQARLDEAISSKK